MGIVNDVDGNSYTTIVIGNQQWFTSNLKTTKYNDNSAIPNVTNGGAWSFTFSGAYCWYNNDIGNKSTYGALYNWYACSTNKLAPTGWRVATDSDYQTLLTYLGGGSVAGGKLKETGTTHWSSPNTGAADAVGFTALPAGTRYTTFSGLGTVAQWWTTDQYDATYAKNYGATYDSAATNGYGQGLAGALKTMGYSVRCVRTVVPLNANFTPSSYYGNAPLTVNFNDTSLGVPETWDWDFGDGSPHGTTQNPSHTYTLAGTYTVTLKVTETDFPDSSISKTINVEIGCDFSANTTSGAAPLSVNFTSITTGGVNVFDWDFGDGSAHATTQNASHSYSVPNQTYTVSLTATYGSKYTTKTRTNYITTVNNPITIISNPTTKKVNIGGSAEFDVTVSGTNPVYQWYKYLAGVTGLISGATGASYIWTNATAPQDNTQLTCTITNIVNHLTTTPAILDVTVLPVITQQPSPTGILHMGDSINISIGATGASAMSYQWYSHIGGVTGIVAGATGISTMITPTTNGESYDCTVTNVDGSTTTNPEVMWVLDDLGLIRDLPIATLINQDTTTTYLVTPTGDDITYQWFRNGILMPGHTGPTETTSIGDTNGTTYYVVIGDPISQVQSNVNNLFIAGPESTESCDIVGRYGTTPYASAKYKIGLCTDVTSNKLHYYALKKIMPWKNLEGDLDNDLTIEGKFLDDVYYRAGYRPQGLLDQFFSDTVTPNIMGGLLEEFARIFQTSVTGNTATDRAAIQTAQQARGGLSIAYYTSLAASLGYPIVVTENVVNVFRIGITTLPHVLFDAGLAWEWTVTVTGFASAPDLEQLINNLKPAYTTVNFVYIP